jgi:transposase-like protein
VIVGKHQTRFTGFDDKIILMYARGMTTRDIEAHLKEMYGVEVSAGLISQVTEAVMEEVKTWQNRALEAVYAIVYLDALYVKMRTEGRVENRAVYVAIGVDLEGHKEVLGLWTSAHEGAKFWLSALTELKNRGVKDMLIVCVDGLKGFPQAIETAFPLAQVQLCIVHLVRASLHYVNWKERKRVAADLKPVYRAATAAEAELELDRFIGEWGTKYNLSRTKEEIERAAGGPVTGEFFHPPDRERMLERVKRTSKQCLIFKVYGASRHCGSRAEMLDALRLAARYAKPSDCVVIGMFPKHKEQVEENCRLVAEAFGTAS